ncbi:hypothetical protein BWI93_14610 [Siphonobacter sp. BAB-5385]|nr:hypothetical protein BWI93_14610 [Siphonobacter sp. BAB-5385]
MFIRDTWKRFGWYVAFVVGVFFAMLAAVIFGERIKKTWQDHKLEKQQVQLQVKEVETDSLKTVIKDTVIRKESEIKALVSVLKEEDPKKLVKVQKADSLIILRVDSARKDTTH